MIVVAAASIASRTWKRIMLIWDGKDDHGKPVASGEYAILIDAAREHGTYQSISKSW